MTSVRIGGYKILRLVILLLLAYTVLTACSIFTVGGSMDFPCVVTYCASDNCITARVAGREAGANAYQIESFLTGYLAGWGGGGCNYGKSETSTLDVQTSVLNLSLERDGDTLKVNGKVLETGTDFQVIDVFAWDPWIISRLRFKNLGMVADCESDTKYQRMVIFGSSGTEFSPAKGLLILSSITGGLIFVRRKLKSLKTLENPHGTDGTTKLM